MVAVDMRATALTRARYDRNAPFYDLMQRAMESLLALARASLWARVRGPRVLEVGVGTGLSMPLYPSGQQIIAVDLSPRMLEQARARAAQLGVAVDLREADAQALPFPDASFDTANDTLPGPVRLRDRYGVATPAGAGTSRRGTSLEVGRSCNLARIQWFAVFLSACIPQQTA
jgi:SAM-dependent methyltransferase